MKSGVTNYKLVLCYDGTDFKGWQYQPKQRTIQGALEDALLKIAGKRIPVFGAGRTDAGVHAEGQVASFKASLSLDNTKLFRALNAILPDDLRVQSIETAPPDFHARRSAVSKIYRYRILNAPRVSPFHLRYVLHVRYPLDLRAMRKAAALFAREADFSAFASNKERHPVRNVTVSRIRKVGNEIVYTIRAEGFLRYMVRTIVGTILEVGKGKIPPEEIEELFRGKKRTLRTPTAAARGLCLVRVFYPRSSRPMTKASSTGLV